ncbi:MAG: OmpA family protein [Flavobacterium sp.]
MWRFILFWLFLTTVVDAQNTYDIIFSSPNHDQVCKPCLDAFMRKPKETQFSVKRDGANLFLEINDKEWLKRLIQHPDDGIAIDVVSKDRYRCNETLEEKQIKGVLLKPLYGNRVTDALKPHGTNLFRLLVGRLTPDQMQKELEYNILFLSQKRLCRYQVIYNLASYPWDLLDMGMYLDTITYQNQTIQNKGKDYILKHKTITFIVPFEKNKSTYSATDIKPLYDSLRITDYTIQTIQIKGYSSVEGTTERNLELQQQRAKSIADALQSFQKPNIKTEVTSSENWVEFFNDLPKTKYADWKTLSKEQIKAKLVGNISKELEPILQMHRKAVVRLELEKIDRYESLTGDQLVAKFNQAIQSDQLAEAKEIQNSIFKKMKAQTVSPTLLEKLQLPKQIKYVGFINNNAAFRAMLDVQESLIVYNQLLELEKLAPKDGKVKYNLAALKIKLWRYKALEVKEADLKTQITDLKKYGISTVLIDRMLLNMHIIKAENQMQSRDYKNKDLSVAFIETTYKKIPLSDFDYLSLAQFFSYYANIDKAVILLDKKSRQIDIDEDLLFYYLNLTLINKELMKKDDYRTILLNANTINPKRFCRMFDAIDKGGVTFQMLENDFLRGVYCEGCR